MPLLPALDDVANALSPTLPSRSCPELETKVLRTLEELERIEPEWRDRWREAYSSPFQCSDWLVPFTRHFGIDELRVVIARDSGRLVCLAPFYLWIHSGAKKLLLLGSGISDYVDIIVRPGFEEVASFALRRFFTETDHDWDRCDLLQVPNRSLLNQLAQPIPATPCPQLDLTRKNLSNYAPEHQLEKLRYYRRRTTRMGDVEFLRSNPSTCEKVMHKLFDLHSARWQNRAQRGVLADRTVQRFHLEAAHKMESSGILRLYSLTLKGSTIAVLYAFASHSRTCFYLTGFDPAFDKLCPGTLLIGHAIEEAIREGHSMFDFLRGQEPYKYKWGAQDRPTYNISIESSSLAAFA